MKMKFMNFLMLLIKELFLIHNLIGFTKVIIMLTTFLGRVAQR